MMRSLSGRRKRDLILADIQRAFAAGYQEKRKAGPPSKLEQLGALEIYAMVSELPPAERRRVLDSLGRPLPGGHGRVKL
jgi:hypothetical protein